jgi:ferredoxin-NADP reductase
MLTTQWTIHHITHSPSGDIVIITCQVEEVFTFFEGQFMVLQTLIDDKIVKRSYSIYSTNQQLQDTKTISFCIKRKDQWVFSTRATQVAAVGMQITMTWPVGRFVDDSASRNYLFISVGSGLSPCFSIYQQLIRTDQYDKIANLFGERVLDHIPWEVLDAYSIQSDKIYNQICLSKEEKIPAYAGMTKGYVQTGLDDALAFLGTQDVTVFICGLPVMCDEVSQILQDKGIEKRRLVIEKY